MKSFTFLFATLAVTLPVLGAPTTPSRLQIKRSPTGEAAPDSYIVVLKDDASIKSHLASLNKVASASDSQSLAEITYSTEYKGLLHGYAAKLTDEALAHVMADDSVAAIHEDAIFHIDTKVVSVDSSTQPREIHEKFARNIQPRKEGGAGVDIYVIDTGILTSHSSFGGRASWGKTFGPYADRDGNGHGTHTAAIAVSKDFGVAKEANVIAVKAVGDNGGGQYSDIMAGIAWVQSQAAITKRPTIINLSFGGTPADYLDNAVKDAMANSGVHFTLAAGNENHDFTNANSPARVTEAITIGSVDNKNNKDPLSNFGSTLDCWAPGVNIKSAYIGNDRATAVMTGTSMAAPFVAGLLAISIEKYGNKSPADLSNDLIAHSAPVVRGNPGGTTNRLCVRY